MFSQANLSTLKEHKIAKQNLRDALSRAVNGSPKCTLDMFRMKASEAGVNLTQHDYRVVLNAFRARGGVLGA